MNAYTCDFETVVEVTSSGRFEAEADCEIRIEGPDLDVTGTWEGSVDEDGNLSGEMEIVMVQRDYEFGEVLEASGSVEEGGGLQVSATAGDYDSEGYELTWFSEVEAD